TRQVVLHDRAEYGRLEVLPLAARLGDGDEVTAKEHAGDARHREQALRQRRIAALVCIAELRRPAAQNLAARKELQAGGIGGLLGLDEHLSLENWNCSKECSAARCGFQEWCATA